MEPLFEDVFLCVLGRKLKRGKAPIALKEYLSFRHISVEALHHAIRLNYGGSLLPIRGFADKTCV